MSDDESKLTRRMFLKHTAMATAATGAWHSIAMKTDAQQQPPPQAPRAGEETVLPYTYHDPPG